MAPISSLVLPWHSQNNTAVSRPDNCHEVLRCNQSWKCILFYLEDYSYNDIGEILHVGSRDREVQWRYSA